MIEISKIPTLAAQWHELHSSYMHSDAWGAKRAAVLARENNLCQGCRRAPATIVHHLTYDHWQSELLYELVALCESCHGQGHDRQRYAPGEAGVARVNEVAAQLLDYIKLHPGTSTELLAASLPDTADVRAAALDWLLRCFSVGRCPINGGHSRGWYALSEETRNNMHTELLCAEFGVPVTGPDAEALGHLCSLGFLEAETSSANKITYRLTTLGDRWRKG